MSIPLTLIILLILIVFLAGGWRYRSVGSLTRNEWLILVGVLVLLVVGFWHYR